jgi:hypothetical protein
MLYSIPCSFISAGDPKDLLSLRSNPLRLQRATHLFTHPALLRTFPFVFFTASSSQHTITHTQCETRRKEEITSEG